MKLFGKHIHDWDSSDSYKQVFQQIIIEHKIKAVIRQQCKTCTEFRYCNSSLSFNSLNEVFCICSNGIANTNCNIHGFRK